MVKFVNKVSNRSKIFGNLWIIPPSFVFFYVGNYFTGDLKLCVTLDLVNQIIFSQTSALFVKELVLCS